MLSWPCGEEMSVDDEVLGRGRLDYKLVHAVDVGRMLGRSSDSSRCHGYREVACSTRVSRMLQSEPEVHQ